MTSQLWRHRPVWVIALASSAIFILLWTVSVVAAALVVRWRAERGGDSIGDAIDGFADLALFVLLALGGIALAHVVWVALLALLVRPRGLRAARAIVCLLATGAASSVLIVAGSRSNGAALWSYGAFALLLVPAACGWWMAGSRSRTD